MHTLKGVTSKSRIMSNLSQSFSRRKPCCTCANNCCLLYLPSRGHAQLLQEMRDQLCDPQTVGRTVHGWQSP